ncbi:hypothetical protein B9Z47_02595 [Limnohabitans sp. 2KL-1]|uniref:class I SAM-dependent methyltransferase n=1 Tax=Limnohabitans sp. 2KL-1 TaxID=1100699 RepID=UPI000D3B698F|nr:class I SAM-dependent methyltransferase [Limnohabitans sp. 2KL-1]PUE50656.1 hypothetical protein B9Z47_02595 [Limnohabitans sp. 2KL-1]
MTNTFYRAFEDRHRGGRQTIKDRLRVYTSFVKPLLETYPRAQAVDLGCGRGEWLELMTEIGYQAQGVDLDEGMLQACHQLGLDAQLGDAIVHLQKLPDQSQAVVSAFHVVEHIAFDQLQELVKQAMRVLLPGGLLIMETPNPENIVVATSNFYVDPSHQRPVPPLLLSFVAEHAGFFRVKTVRLQESKELLFKSNVNLQEVFSGVSPDFAVVAQKNADEPILALTEYAFNADYGLDLALLLRRWDTRFEQLELQLKHFEVLAQQAFENSLQAQNFAKHAELKAQQAELKAQQAELVSQHAQSTAESLHSHAQNLEHRLQEVQHHYTWRITAPFRWFESQLKRLRQEGLTHRTKALGKKIVRKSIGLIEQKPRLRRLLVRLSQKVGIYQHLKKVSHTLSPELSILTTTDIEGLMVLRDVSLSPCSQKIHDDLLREIGNIQKGRN